MIFEVKAWVGLKLQLPITLQIPVKAFQNLRKVSVQLIYYDCSLKHYFYCNLIHNDKHSITILNVFCYSIK